MVEAVTCRPVTAKVHIWSLGICGKVTRSRIFSKYISFPPASIILSVFLTHVHLKTTLIRMTSMQSPSTFQQSSALLEIGNYCKERQSLNFCVSERVEF